MVNTLGWIILICVLVFALVWLIDPEIVGRINKTTSSTTTTTPVTTTTMIPTTTTAPLTTTTIPATTTTSIPTPTTPNCNYCIEGSGGNTSMACGLYEDWNEGKALSDEEWYWFNCFSVGGISRAEFLINSTNGGMYELCVKEYQDPDQCPQSTDICHPVEELFTIDQFGDENYWILAHRISGPAGYKIYLDCHIA